MKFMLCAVLGMCISLVSGCMHYDYYSEVESACAISLDECTTAVEPFVPFDDKSFEVAPPWYKRKVAEGFAAIAWYPLRLPPENKIFGGVAPYSIPNWHLKILNRDSSPNKSLFNYMLNIIQIIEFVTPSHPDDGAQYTPHLRGGKMTLYPSTILHQYAWPLSSARLFVHEAHHGSGFFHVLCEDGDEFGCDTNLLGPEGLAITYQTMLIHGGGQRFNDGTKPLLGANEVVALERASCHSLKTEILKHPKELSELLDATDCARINYQWTVQNEGLRL